MNNFIKSEKVAISLTLRSLVRNKKGTALSILGVIIGVMLVIIVLSLGTGMKEYVIDQVESFGSDIIELEVKVPGTDKSSSGNTGGIATGTVIKTLTLTDAEDLAKLDNLGAWYAGIMTQNLVSFNKFNKTTMIMAVTSGIFEVDKNLKLEKGKKFTAEDCNNYKNYVVLGGEIAKDFFGKQEAIGKKVKIGNQKYTVKGVLKIRGSTGFLNFDNIVYIPAQSAQRNLLRTDYVQWVVFKSKDISKDTSTIKAMEKIIRKNHNINKTIDDDFAVTSMSETTEIVDQVFSILNALLVGLTSISLLIGGVGIMNVMYVAVTARTFEIGLRKALGAKNKDILKQFIYEAFVLTMVGGIIGIIAGSIVSKIAELIALKFDFILNFPVTLFSIILAVGFSMITGIVFGYKPAKKASQLTPMEALGNK